MAIVPVPCDDGSGGGGGTPVDPANQRFVSWKTFCDDNGPFLRRIVVDGNAVTVSETDYTLDAVTPYTTTGTVDVCSTDAPCDSPTTPLATTGLCLADGSPITVVHTRDCDGTVTQDGWINLATGAYNSGAPPSGVVACGDTRSIQVSGTFCDMDQSSGDVLGLVLIEYEYAQDGSISSVRLVDATTGNTYTVQGTLTTCPAGVEQPESDLLALCDDQGGGLVTPFLRDYHRDENGQIVAHTDYGLDGGSYAPAGTVTICGDLDEESPGEACPVANVVERCRCDDTDGDGVGDVEYTELFAVDCLGGVYSIGTYTQDLSAPYTPVSPVECTPTGDDIVGVQARRTQVTDGATWDISAATLPQAVTFTNVDGPASSISTADGASSLFPGESISWGVVHEYDSSLRGPLSVTAGAGSTVTVAWTEAVTAP